MAHSTSKSIVFEHFDFKHYLQSYALSSGTYLSLEDFEYDARVRVLEYISNYTLLPHLAKSDLFFKREEVTRAIDVIAKTGVL